MRKPVQHMVNEKTKVFTCANTTFQEWKDMVMLEFSRREMLPLELHTASSLPAINNHSISIQERASQALQKVGLTPRVTHLPKHMSGGEQQRVAIARAFVGQPKILFADEPTGNLDATTGAQIIELMLELNRAHGTTLILVTHDEALARRCSRQIHLAAGRVVI